MTDGEPGHLTDDRDSRAEAEWAGRVGGVKAGGQGPPFATYWPDGLTGPAGLWREFQRGHGDCRTSFVRYFGEMILKMAGGQPMCGVEGSGFCVFKGRALLPHHLTPPQAGKRQPQLAWGDPVLPEASPCLLHWVEMNARSTFVERLSHVMFDHTDTKLLPRHFCWKFSHLETGLWCQTWIYLLAECSTGRFIDGSVRFDSPAFYCSVKHAGVKILLCLTNIFTKTPQKYLGNKHKGLNPSLVSK